MRLRILRSLWGVTKEAGGARALDDALPLIAALGYDGVEVPYKMVLEVGVSRFGELLKRHCLDASLILFTDGPLSPGFPGPLLINGGPYTGHPPPAMPGDALNSALVEKHVAAFEAQLRGACAFNEATGGRVVSCNSHSGSDRFTMDMGVEFFGRVLELEAECGSGGSGGSGGVPVFHETHRTRFLYSPWVARDLLPAFPALKLTADLSHWTNVAEVGPDNADLVNVVQQAASQCHEIHARVGFEEGPQVSDPRAPEWMTYTEGFERLWDLLWDAQAAAGLEVSTLVPEHGPGLYQPSVHGLDLGEDHWPAPGFPLADIWDVNHWLALRARARFGARFGVGEDGHNAGAVVESATQGAGAVSNVFLEDWQTSRSARTERESVTLTLARNFALDEAERAVEGGGASGAALSASARALAALEEDEDEAAATAAVMEALAAQEDLAAKEAADYDEAERSARWLAQLESHHGLEKWRHKMEDAADDVLYASQRAQECAEEALDLGIEGDDKATLRLAQDAQSLAQESEELALDAQNLLEEALAMAEEAQTLVEEAADKAQGAQELAEDAQERADEVARLRPASSSS